jgi:hypothetical protein
MRSDHGRLLRAELLAALRDLNIPVTTAAGARVTPTVVGRGPGVRLELGNRDAGTLAAHLVPAAALRPYPGAVLWHIGRHKLVVVHRVISPVRLALRDRDRNWPHIVPYITHISQLTIPDAAGLEGL